MVDENQLDKQIRQVSDTMRIERAVKNLTQGPQSDLDLLLEDSGYKQAKLEGIPYNGNGQLYVCNEEIKQTLDESQKIPPFQNEQKTCELDLIVSAKYSAQIAIVEGESVKLRDVTANGKITRHFQKVIPKDTLSELEIGNIIKKEGYRSLMESDPHFIVPKGYKVVRINNLKVELIGVYTQLGDNPYERESKKFQVNAKGELQVTAEMLINSPQGLLYLNAILSKSIDDTYDVMPGDARDVKNGKDPSEMPKFSGRLDLKGVQPALRIFEAKRNELYMGWIRREIQNLPIDSNVRGQLGLNLDNAKATYDGNDAFIELGRRAIEARKQA